jgi:hypothetical protein
MIRTTRWVTTVLLGLAAPALAQSDTTNITQENVEIMPFAGWRTGGGLTGDFYGTTHDFGIQSAASYGGALDFNLHGGNFKIEVLYSRQSTNLSSVGFVLPNDYPLTVEYLQAGLLQETGSEKSRFYVSVLLGATRFAPQGYDSVTKFSASLGGGLKLFPSRHVGLRFDARAYVTFVQTDGATFCANGTCVFAYSGSHLWQGDFTGGLIFAF